MQAKANTDEINVTETSCDNINDSALYTLQNVLGEDDAGLTQIIKNNHMLIMRAKGSSTFMFAEFD